MSVVGFHAFPETWKAGFIGVDIFFVISGFLITGILLESLEQQTFRLSDFYARRIRRIFPALLIVLLSSLSVGWFFLLGDEVNQLGEHVAAGAAFVSNFVLWNEAGYFDNAADTKPLLHLWSLGIEEQFYIAWPLLLWLAWKRKINTAWIILACALASFLWNITSISRDPTAAFYSPLSRVWELLAGSLLAWLVLHGKELPTATRNIASFTGTALLLVGLLQIDRNSAFPGYWALLPVIGTTLIIAAGPSALLNRTLLSNRLLVGIGLISFPLYLWHWPILSLARIIHSETPSLAFRMLAIGASIVLAWATFQWAEKPIRFGKIPFKRITFALSAAMLVTGLGALLLSKVDLSSSHGFENLPIKRKGFEHAIGSSLNWYRGKEDWLFLGDAYHRTVSKLTMAIEPDAKDIQETRALFESIAKAAEQTHTKVVLLLGPNKSRIYPEYLPDSVVPSSRRYVDAFLQDMASIGNLDIIDPTRELLRRKKTDGILYSRTDTHWNRKGAFIAYTEFTKAYALPVSPFEFEAAPIKGGDLFRMSKLADFPLHPGDLFRITKKTARSWTEVENPQSQKTPFGTASLATNPAAPSSQSIWVIGDSFTVALKPYFNESFREVRYVGHWDQRLKDLPTELMSAQKKPDMIVIVRVERTF